MVDPVCGDGTCNGDEDETSCCSDCGCVGGWTCTDGACVADPFCGDGTCNGDEDQTSCCDDCGCGDTYACEANACVCQGATAHFANVRPNRQEFCALAGQWYTQESVAFINVGSQGTLYLRSGGWTEYSGTQGETMPILTQCCYLDPCNGEQNCPTPNGNYPCNCESSTRETVTLDQCGQNVFALCD